MSTPGYWRDRATMFEAEFLVRNTPMHPDGRIEAFCECMDCGASWEGSPQEQRCGCPYDTAVGVRSAPHKRSGFVGVRNPSLAPQDIVRARQRIQIEEDDVLSIEDECAIVQLIAGGSTPEETA